MYVQSVTLTDYAGTQVPKDGVSMTATCMAAVLMIFTLYLLRSIAHGVHAWLTSCRGRLQQGTLEIMSALCKVYSGFRT